nr:O-fucosyltransferase 23-like [Ipomoea batatas]
MDISNRKHLRSLGLPLNSLACKCVALVVIALVLRAVLLPRLYELGGLFEQSKFLVAPNVSLTSDSESLMEKSKFLEVPQIIWGLNNQKIAFARACLTARMLKRKLLMPSLSASLFYKEVDLLQPISFDKVFQFGSFNSRCSEFVQLGHYSEISNQSDVVELQKGLGRRLKGQNFKPHNSSCKTSHSYISPNIHKNPIPVLVFHLLQQFLHSLRYIRLPKRLSLESPIDILVGLLWQIPKVGKGVEEWVFKTLDDIGENGELFLLILILGLASSRIDCQIIFGHGQSFSVLDYGAIGDGTTNDTQAFLNAWRDACGSRVESPLVIIPQSFRFLVFPLTFWGPCNSQKIYFMISGEIIAPSSMGTWKGRDASEWVVFRDVKGLTIDGSGTIDGQGKPWWDNSCRYHPSLVGRGTVRDVIFENLLFNYVGNPIIIDQHYCNIQGACRDTGSGVKISNIVYRDIFGTSSTDVAINLNCSKSVPCTNIVMQFVQLSSATPGKIVSADCENAYGQEYGVGPTSCLLQS